MRKINIKLSDKQIYLQFSMDIKSFPILLKLN